MAQPATVQHSTRGCQVTQTVRCPVLDWLNTALLADAGTMQSEEQGWIICVKALSWKIYTVHSTLWYGAGHHTTNCQSWSPQMQYNGTAWYSSLA